MSQLGMSLEKARTLVDRCLSDDEIHRLYAAADDQSRHQTKHDLQHAIDVVKSSRIVAEMIQNNGNVELSDWERDVIVPLAAYLHDIGRAIDVDDHAAAGAKWAKKYLSSLTLPGDDEHLPTDVINRICKIIACHRSSSVLKATNMDAAWAAVVIADKCVGDEERVRPLRAMVLHVLTFFRLSWIPLRRGGVHDRVNFAIKKVELVNEAKSVILRLTLDTRVCRPELVYKTYTDRFQACTRAARFLGLDFELELNGKRFAFGSEGNWQPVGGS